MGYPNPQVNPYYPELKLADFGMVPGPAVPTNYV